MLCVRTKFPKAEMRSELRDDIPLNAQLHHIAIKSDYIRDMRLRFAASIRAEVLFGILFAGLKVIRQHQCPGEGRDSDNDSSG